MQEAQVQPLDQKDPWSKKRQPTPAFLPSESYGQRSLAGYSPWGCKELDTTEHHAESTQPDECQKTSWFVSLERLTLPTPFPACPPQAAESPGLTS